MVASDALEGGYEFLRRKGDGLFPRPGQAFIDGGLVPLSRYGLEAVCAALYGMRLSTEAIASRRSVCSKSLYDGRMSVRMRGIHDPLVTDRRFA